MRPNFIPVLMMLTYVMRGSAAGNAPGRKRARTEWPAYEEVRLVQHPRLRYGNESQSQPVDVREFQRRFTDASEAADSASAERARKMAGPATRRPTTTESSSSLLDYFEDKGEGDDDEEEEEEEEDDDDEDDEEDDDDDYDDDDEDDDKKGTDWQKDKKKSPLRGGRRRQYVKAHKIIFPLLLAYKLKFFTMLPLLVGSLVLLIGTTGIAGFFFALFSAALGLQVKNHHHHHH